MKIEDYEFGKIIIGEDVYEKDLIIINKEPIPIIIPDWRREKGHLLQDKDLVNVWNYNPHFLVIGKGYYGKMIVDKAICIKDIQCKIIEKPTREAIKIFNKLSENKEKLTIGAFHLTC